MMMMMILATALGHGLYLKYTGCPWGEGNGGEGGNTREEERGGDEKSGGSRESEWRGQQGSGSGVEWSGGEGRVENVREAGR